jgi:hypothetical protein
MTVVLRDMVTVALWLEISVKSSPLALPLNADSKSRTWSASPSSLTWSYT